MSAELNLSELRPWLDEHERYAKSIPAGDPRSDIARQMLAVVDTARRSLLPSADSTANYVPNKEFITELAVLRDQAEHIVSGDDAKRNS
jgi:hypothetical protein